MSKRPKRNNRGLSERRVGTRDTLPRFLIVCEGTKTEPGYFKSFRVSTINIIDIDVRGIGFSTISLVKEAVKIKEHETNERKMSADDQTWCVFDRDDFPAEHFNQAIQFAKQHDIKVAYSNQCFELWYLLHFDYHNAGISRTAYNDLLSKKLNRTYKKNMPDMYQLLEKNQPAAIKNAQRLLKQYNPPKPAEDNPSTTVHLLVEQLNRFKRP